MEWTNKEKEKENKEVRPKYAYKIILCFPFAPIVRVMFRSEGIKAFFDPLFHFHDPKQT
jgi:hypothetical protein